MSGTVGIVEVPPLIPGQDERGSRRTTPAARRFGNHSLLEWVVRRVTDSLLLDQVVVLTDSQQGELISRLAPPDVRVLVGASPDPLTRFAAAVKTCAADRAVRVPVASPFLDPTLIDRLVCTSVAQPTADYIGYVASRGGPAVLARLGLFAEWCRAEAIFRADREAVCPEERNPPTRYLYSHPELFRLRLIPVPPQLDRDDLRLTVKVEEDWEHAHIIFEALGREALDWQRIAELLDHQPALRRRMAVLNQAEQCAP